MNSDSESLKSPNRFGAEQLKRMGPVQIPGTIRKPSYAKCVCVCARVFVFVCLLACLLACLLVCLFGCLF